MCDPEIIHSLLLDLLTELILAQPVFVDQDSLLVARTHSKRVFVVGVQKAPLHVYGTLVVLVDIDELVGLEDVAHVGDAVLFVFVTEHQNVLVVDRVVVVGLSILQNL